MNKLSIRRAREKRARRYNYYNRITNSRYPNDHDRSQTLGRIGEDEVAESFKNIRNKALILRNLIIGDEGMTTEIDCLVISAGGIHVIESKNYNATVYSHADDDYWDIAYPGGRIFRILSPVEQNESHIRALRYTLQNSISEDIGHLLHSVVVFSDETVLNDAATYRENLMIINLSELTHHIDESIDYFRSKGASYTLSPELMLEIYQALYPYSVKTQEEREQHILNVRQRWGNKEEYDSDD